MARCNRASLTASKRRQTSFSMPSCMRSASSYSVLLFGMAMPSFNKLTPDQQRAIEDAGKEAGRFMRDLADKLDLNAVADLQKAGIRVDKIDKVPLVTAMQPVYKELA